jgi:hypothetical protein
VERTCSKCGTTGEVGPVFQPKQGNTCRRCNIERDRQWRLEVQAEGGDRHERRKEQMRLAQAKRVYGLTEEEARALYTYTDCEICGRDNGPRRLSIDHCHDSGVVRGMLCNRCNGGLGFFRHDVDLLLAAAEYLRYTRS